MKSVRVEARLVDGGAQDWTFGAEFLAKLKVLDARGVTGKDLIHQLILDDWGLAPLADRERRDLLEVIEDRSGRRATLVTSQVPVDHWHDLIGDATFGDAIMDRLVHHAHRITLTGASLRRLSSTPTESSTEA